MPKSQPKEYFEFCPKAYSKLRSFLHRAAEWDDAQHPYCSPVRLTQVSQARWIKAGKWRSGEATLLRCCLHFLICMNC